MMLRIIFVVLVLVVVLGAGCQPTAGPGGSDNDGVVLCSGHAYVYEVRDGRTQVYVDGWVMPVDRDRWTAAGCTFIPTPTKE